jgi:hypothetical protein
MFALRECGTIEVAFGLKKCAGTTSMNQRRLANDYGEPGEMLSEILAARNFARDIARSVATAPEQLHVTSDLRCVTSS